jgi:hypothetical protein
MSTTTTKPAPITIDVTLSTIIGRGRYGRFESAYYECFGPDGRKFTNSSKATLKSVLTSRYGKVILAITDVREPQRRY